MRLTVLRFNDADVKRDITDVLMAIEGWIESTGSFSFQVSSLRSPLLRGERRQEIFTHLK